MPTHWHVPLMARHLLAPISWMSDRVAVMSTSHPVQQTVLVSDLFT